MRVVRAELPSGDQKPQTNAGKELPPQIEMWNDAPDEESDAAAPLADVAYPAGQTHCLAAATS
jgi:hypothetical protein